MSNPNDTIIMMCINPVAHAFIPPIIIEPPAPSPTGTVLGTEVEAVSQTGIFLALLELII